MPLRLTLQQVSNLITLLEDSAKTHKKMWVAKVLRTETWKASDRRLRDAIAAASRAYECGDIGEEQRRLLSESLNKAEQVL